LEQEKIRVLIANSTRIWRDMLYDTIREEPDIEVVGDVSEEPAILRATERTNPDCVIVPLDELGAALPICTEILTKRPNLRIVAIGDRTDVVEIYWMSQEGDIRRTYSTASREAIVKALHFSAA
jgi:DNA-binding NarL/FixJ family response regulator